MGREDNPGKKAETRAGKALRRRASAFGWSGSWAQRVVLGHPLPTEVSQARAAERFGELRDQEERLHGHGVDRSAQAAMAHGGVGGWEGGTGDSVVANVKPRGAPGGIEAYRISLVNNLVNPNVHARRAAARSLIEREDFAEVADTLYLLDPDNVMQSLTTSPDFLSIHPEFEQADERMLKRLSKKEQRAHREKFERIRASSPHSLLEDPQFPGVYFVKVYEDPDFQDMLIETGAQLVNSVDRTFILASPEVAGRRYTKTEKIVGILAYSATADNPGGRQIGKQVVAHRIEDLPDRIGYMLSAKLSPSAALTQHQSLTKEISRNRNEIAWVRLGAEEERIVKIADLWAEKLFAFAQQGSQQAREILQKYSSSAREKTASDKTLESVSPLLRAKINHVAGADPEQKLTMDTFMTIAKRYANQSVDLDGF